MAHDTPKELVRSWVNDPTLAIGEALYRALDRFRPPGAPVELRPLLQSDDPRLSDAGMWIASELGEKAAPLIDEIMPLLRDSRMSIRFDAINCLLCCHRHLADRHALLVAERLGDTELAVRVKAMQFFASVGASLVESVFQPLGGANAVGHKVNWLAFTAGQGPQFMARFRQEIEDATPTERIWATICAARQIHAEPGLLDIANEFQNADTKLFIERWRESPWPPRRTESSELK